MSTKKTKILICLSGGVDSSVAGALLVEQGYDVSGAFMVNYEDPGSETICWRDDYLDALRVAAKLGIKLLRLNFVKEYEEMVLSYMYREYKAGRTPNPDVMCNKFIKFGFWLDKAKELGFDYIATGHYARLSFPRRRESSVRLLMSKDKNKDQTYFLNQLSQNQLARTMFPVGDYTKSEVRALAKKFDLPTAEKAESMGICFVGEVPMKEFLQRKIKKHPGKIILSPTAYHSRDQLFDRFEKNGNLPQEVAIGRHDGLAFYTIGQRIGLSSVCHSEAKSTVCGRSQWRRHKNPPNSRGSFPATAGQDDNTKPLFVLAKNPEKNQLIVGYEDDPLLFKQSITVSAIHWISGQTPKFPLKCEVRLRHRQPLRTCVVKCHPKLISGSLSDQPLSIQFTVPERAPTPGQFAVFFQDGVCLGGGVIE